MREQTPMYQQQNTMYQQQTPMYQQQNTMYQQQTPMYQQQNTMPQQPAPTPPKKSGLAIAGLVLGIVAAATSFLPIINNVSFFLALVGLIFGIVGVVQTRKGTKSGGGIAIASVVLNVAACAIVLASQSLFGAALDSATESIGSSSKSVSSSASSQAATSSMQQSGTIDNATKYEVTIDEATSATDYAGAPALVVTYTWTNNSDEDMSFASALHAKCFQNGVQCETTIVSGIDGDSLTQVKPGASTTVQQAYKLTDTSDATVEVTELISFDNEVLAEKTFPIA